MNRCLGGALGGLLATIPMTLAMVTLFRRLPADEQYPLPPREITEELTRRAGQSERLGDGQQGALSLALHFGYGGLTGAFYPLLAGSGQLAPILLGSPLRQTLFGSSYGMAVWAGSYLGWIPALQLLGPATAQPVHRRSLMIGAHLVWGAATVLIGEQLVERSRQPRRTQSLGIIE